MSPSSALACPGRALENDVAATNAVVAICVVLVPTAAVGAAGVPVNVGDAIGAFAVTVFRSECVTVTAPETFGNVVLIADLMFLI